MVAWESSITQEERQQLASYILTLRGTTPAAPKAPEGDLWEGTAKKVEEAVDTLEEGAKEIIKEVKEVVHE